MSTPATAKSTYLAGLVKKFTAKSKVLKLGCVGLEDAVEKWDKKEIARLLNLYLEKVTSFKADTIVLGCTHYPFLKKEIKKRLKAKIKIIDSGKPIAKRVKNILLDSKSLAKRKKEDFYFTTGSQSKFSKVASTLLQYKVKGQKVRLPQAE